MSIKLRGCGRLRLKCDGTRAETRFRLSAKWTSPFKSAGASVQSTTGSRGVRISGTNAAYTMFRGSVQSTAYPLHSPVSPSLPLSCVNVCHHMCVCFVFLSVGDHQLTRTPNTHRLYTHAATYCVIIRTQRTQISGRNSNGTKHSGGPPEDGREKGPKHVGVLYLQTRF